MGRLELQFLGSGDAFGSGGRFQTCLLLRDGESPLLIDCGASSLIAMNRAGVDPSEIGWVVLTHLHGDHFGGLPFMVLHGQFNRRELPLGIAGPPGVRQRVEAAMEVLFPGSSGAKRRFATDFVELAESKANSVGPAAVTPFAVQHASGAPAFALRVDYGGKTIAYSGDAEWSESVVEAARGADLFVCEAYYFEKKVKFHLDYKTVREHLPELECERIVLTHMSSEMLSRADEADIELAEDGQTITL